MDLLPQAIDRAELNRESSHSDDFEILGHSVEGRPLVAHFCGYRAANLRIFILAGQHGDESDAREAAADFLNRVRSRAVDRTAHIAVLADANPDGATAHTRRNASHLDLNRDHMVLSAPETAAVHAFVDRWQPDLILDVHTYRPWRRELLQFDFVFPQDVMIDFPTNPAACTSLLPDLETDLLDFVKERCSGPSIRCDRYTRVRPSGIIRHSNFDICDARNSLALRFDIPTVLLEGRRASPGDRPVFIPTANALLRCIEAVIEWAVGHTNLLRLKPPQQNVGASVPVRCEYSSSDQPKYMEMQSAVRGTIRVVGMPGVYLPIVRTTRTVAAPKAYAVPRNLTDVLSILSRQRFEALPMEDVKKATAQAYHIHSVSPAVDEDYGALPHYSLETTTLRLEDFVVFSTDRQGGRLLAMFLEPDSQFGPHRIPELAAALHPGSRYPVARLI